MKKLVTSLMVFCMIASMCFASGSQEAEGNPIIWAKSGPEGTALLAAAEAYKEETGKTVDVVIQGRSGYRPAYNTALLAGSTELDAVMGLDRGADDYIAKPFGIMELISRVKALMRRVENSRPSVMALGGIAIDDMRHVVTSDGAECTLTFKEYELLKYLILNKGIVLTRDRLMDTVWGTDYEGGSRTVDMHIKTLRQKLGENGAHIKTVRNVGYKIE